jgi:hypothetical protein
MWLLKFAKDRILGVDAQDNKCHHISGMERLAYYRLYVLLGGVAIVMVFSPSPHGPRGVCGGNHSKS